MFLEIVESITPIGINDQTSYKTNVASTKAPCPRGIRYDYYKMMIAPRLDWLNLMS